VPCASFTLGFYNRLDPGHRDVNKNASSTCVLHAAVRVGPTDFGGDRNLLSRLARLTVLFDVAAVCLVIWTTLLEQGLM
jgi:hypothetical protein